MSKLDLYSIFISHVWSHGKNVGQSAQSGSALQMAQFFDAANLQPLAPDIMDEIIGLQRRWSDEVDMKAEPFTM